MNSTPPVAWLNFACRPRRGLADVLADQVGAGDLDQVAVGEHLELRVDAGEQAGDGGLGGAGVADEDHVPGPVGDRHAGRDPHLLAP